ncbi:diguanylate cyclase [Deinococcus sp. YIM 134068]|uniref:diguanylate cyclase domain-containing protein n=1 Tax=Deinococcus lichenicola TaxID=3118910 RepID=UPI002F9376A3
MAGHRQEGRRGHALKQSSAGEPLEVLALLQGSDPTLILERGEAGKGTGWPGHGWRVAFANLAFARLVGGTPEDMRGATLDELFAGAGENLRAVVPNALELAERGQPFRVDLPLRVEDVRWMEAQVTPLRLDASGLDSPVTHWLAVLRDVTAQRQALVLATGHTRAMHLAARDAPLPEIVGALIATLDERLSGSAACASLLDGEDLFLVGPLRLPPSGVETRLPARDARAFSCGGAVYAGHPVLALTPDGFPDALRGDLLREGYRRAYSVPIHEAGGPVLGAMTLYGRRAAPPHPAETALLAQFADLAALLIGRRQALRHLEQLAFHDTLTGLANRAHFMRVLEGACADLDGSAPGRGENGRGGRRGAGTFAVGILDLNGFKLVNDAHGHAAGDGLLTTLATRLTASLPGDVLVARMGGDEFALLVPGATARRLQSVRGTLGNLLASPVTVGDATVRLSGSLGWSLAPHEARTPDALLRQADRAMYEVKRVARSSRAHLPPDGEVFQPPL